MKTISLVAIRQAFSQDKILHWGLHSVSAVTWWQQTVSLYPQTTQHGSRHENWQTPSHNDVFCLRNHVSSWFSSVCDSAQFGVGAVHSLLSLTRLVLVTRWQACKQSDWCSQQTAEALFSFWLIFRKLTLAATQSWCKGRLCFRLFVIYHTLAGWAHSVSAMKIRPESTAYFTESEIS